MIKCLKFAYQHKNIVMVMFNQKFRNVICYIFFSYQSGLVARYDSFLRIEGLYDA